mmetsp:Transcript_8188/g.13287  ORF Transcript_8188/g.13287 Transcript_8188/m.13287 type:complete len:94 (-) Transcript_8188:856-1137(-)
MMIPALPYSAVLLAFVVEYVKHVTNTVDYILRLIRQWVSGMHHLVFKRSIDISACAGQNIHRIVARALGNNPIVQYINGMHVIAIGIIRKGLQ